MKITSLLACCLLIAVFHNNLNAQTTAALPVTDMKGDTSKPLIFYLCGDGGWNRFSTSFIQTMNAKGYPVVGFNAKEYFWKKKDANQTAKDVVSILTSRLQTFKYRKIVLIGYSFGADVMPFIVTRSPREIQDKLKYIVLMSPSETTDFEIHLTDLLGIGKGSGESVPQEINKISQPILFLFGEKEDDFSFKNITIHNYQVNKLPGGHHYDGDAAAVCSVILTYIQ